MRSDYLQRLRGAEVGKAARDANLPVSMTVKALMDRDGKQADIAAEKEKMLRCEHFPTNDNDQYYEVPPAGSSHKSVTEHAV